MAPPVASSLTWRDGNNVNRTLGAETFVGSDATDYRDWTRFFPGADPQAIHVHRSAINAADGTTKPAANSGLWLPNDFYYQHALVFVDTTGSPTGCTLRPYVRQGGSTGPVGTAAVQTLSGTPNFDCFFDVWVWGGDILIYVETLSGGSAPTVTAKVVFV